MNSNLEKDLIQKTADYVKHSLIGAEGGHDWWHTYRVWKTAKQIAKKEKNANQLVVELGALLHDIADQKFHNEDEKVGSHTTRQFLSSIKLDEKIGKQVENIVANISFKGERHHQEFKSLELNIIQDADRLDAIGAIGIARVFNFGGYLGREIYNPNILPRKNLTKEQYVQRNFPSINHFYEKLLLLKDRMNTKTGKMMAQRRHKFMERYLDQFYKEWNGKT